jgi:hypothetical protein
LRRLLIRYEKLLLGGSFAEDQFEHLKGQIAQLKKEGKTEDVLRMQAELKKQIDNKYREQLAETPQVTGSTGSRSRSSRHGSSSIDHPRGIRDRHRKLSPHDVGGGGLMDYDEVLSHPYHLEDEHEEEIRRRREEIRARHLAAREFKPSPDLEADLKRGLSDERALHHMSQSKKKAGILQHKLNRGEGTFHQEELLNYQHLVEKYLQLEKIVATFLQKTSEDYEKARSIRDKTQRKQYLESVKAAWDTRKPQEKAAREAARDSFLQIKHMLDGHLSVHEEL